MELIKEFEAQIDQKDSHYIKAIQTMSEDIDNLISQMKEQFVEMREYYDQQLQGIESEFDRERTAILSRNKDEVENLFKDHRTIESDYLSKRQEQEAENAADLEFVMRQDANKQAEQKIKLETEMQILEKCMEDMKAVYKLNQEKLGFNFDVLHERQTVFNKQKKGLKFKQQRDRQKLTEERELFEVQQTDAKNLNIQYTKEYKLFTNEFIKLQQRFEKFEKADDKRIKEIWSMNDREARALVEKIMHADKVIHLQQLSIKWEPPRDQFFAFLSESNAVAGDSSYKGAESATQGNSLMNQNTSIMDSQGGQNAQAQSKSELVDDQSVGTKNENTTREKYDRMK